MSLAATDFSEIRSVIREEIQPLRDEVRSLIHDEVQELRNDVRAIVREETRPLHDEVQALRNDIKEIYDEIAEIKSQMAPDRAFEKLSLEQKLLRLNSELLAAAKQAHVTLPR